MKEYLDELKNLLVYNKIPNYENILNAYAQQISKFQNDGLSDSEIISILGTPEQILLIEKNKIVPSPIKRNSKNIFLFSFTVIFILVFLSFLYILLVTSLSLIFMLISQKTLICFSSIILTFITVMLTIIVVSYEIKSLKILRSNKNNE